MYKVVIDCTETEFREAHAQLTQGLFGRAKPLKINPELSGKGAFVESATGQVMACCFVYAPTATHGRTFGHFEAENNLAAVRKMFNMLKTVYDSLVGPMNGSTWEEYRVSEARATLPFLTDISLPDYYSELLSEAGLQELKRYYSTLDTEMHFDAPWLEAELKNLAQCGIQLRTIRLHKFEEELEQLHPFCQETFSQNFMFSTITQQRFIAKYLEIKPVLISELVLIAEDASGICGLMLAFPNLLDTARKGIVIKTLARKQTPEYAGLGSVLGSALVRNAVQNGYTYAVHAFMEESNRSRKVSARFNGAPLQTYQLFSL